jgi:hypothetical protein
LGSTIEELYEALGSAGPKSIKRFLVKSRNTRNPATRVERSMIRLKSLLLKLPPPKCKEHKEAYKTFGFS